MKQATIDSLAAWLLAHDDFILMGHVSPDGDATGSCIALMLALRARGKRAFVCLPGGVAKMYQRYPHADEVVRPEDELPFAPETAFAVDVSDEGRLGGAKALFDRCSAQGLLDHHGTNPGFGEIGLIDGDSAATGELVVALIEKLGVELTQEMARWLYIAISTDCGQFSYSNTRPETLEAAAKLMRTGLDVARLTCELYRTRSKARTLLLGRILSGLTVSTDGKIAWARLTDKMLEEAGALREDNEGVVNYLLEIAGVEVAVLAEERGEATKFSLRSKEYVDVASQIAMPFGGGGHVRAAGCTLAMPMEDALAAVLRRTKEVLQNTEIAG